MVEYLCKKRFLLRKRLWDNLNTFLILYKYQGNVDKYAWKINTKCNTYKKYFSIRTCSFFENPNINMGLNFRIIGKHFSKQSQHCIISSIISVSRSSIHKIYKKIIKDQILI